MAADPSLMTSPPATVERLAIPTYQQIEAFGYQRFTNREQSRLDFGGRLLDLAEDDGVPLLERTKFLAIFSELLDEFFQVRVAALEDQVAAGVRTRSVDGMRPGEQLKMIRGRVEDLVHRQDGIFLDQIVPALADAGIVLSDWSSLDDDDRTHMVDVFAREIFPVLTPLAVDPGHPFPYISNLSLNLVVEVQDPMTGERRIARVKVPPVLPRFVVMPDGERFVPLEQVIAAHLDALFPGMTVGHHYAFRVTRNADLALEEDEADDLLVAIEMELRRRRFGRALRALRDNSVAAVSFGVNPYFYKTLAFAWSAALAGIAGAFFAIATAYVSPDTFTFALSITLLIGAVLGGITSFWGALVGAVVIEFLPLVAQQVNAAAPSVVYGVTLILVMLFAPDGVVGFVRRLIHMLARVPAQPVFESPVQPAAPRAADQPSRE